MLQFVLATWSALLSELAAAETGNANWWQMDSVVLHGIEPPITVQRAWVPARMQPHPVILLMGSLATNALPDWSTNLVREGYMLVAFTAGHPPDPDRARRPQWLVFDERFAHSYVLGGARTPADTSRVIDHLLGMNDVDPDRIGWMGSSTTGIFGLAVAAHEPRLKTLVAFVATGAYERWLETWKPNGLWRSGTNDLWPETRTLLATVDPIHSVSNLFPKAILLINGGGDKVVDPASTQSFVDATRPFYTRDPERLRFVRYEGFTHNLPNDVVRMYAEHWFHLYLHPTNPPPAPQVGSLTLDESTRKTAVTPTKHDQVVGAGREIDGNRRGAKTSENPPDSNSTTPPRSQKKATP